MFRRDNLRAHTAYLFINSRFRFTTLLSKSESLGSDYGRKKDGESTGRRLIRHPPRGRLRSDGEGSIYPSRPGMIYRELRGEKQSGYPVAQRIPFACGTTVVVSQVIRDTPIASVPVALLLT
jgi:hypothetical protein